MGYNGNTVVGECFALGEVTAALKETHGRANNTVHTYLTHMSKKRLVIIDKSSPSPYKAAVSRENVPKRKETSFFRRFITVPQVTL